MRLTLIYPAMGHRPGERYIRSWQMEPLPSASLAGLTPRGIDLRFYDDRLETIPYDEPTDAVAISVETYTARRAYQIARAYRDRGVPVVMGGFHATLAPEEVEKHADAVVTGPAEELWAEVVDDLRHGTPRPRYSAPPRPRLDRIRVDRSILAGKRYLPVSLVETGRGCPHGCVFCAVSSFFHRTHSRRPIDHVVDEVRRIKRASRLIFFVDDNFLGDLRGLDDLLTALEPLGVRWVTQLTLHAAHDPGLLERLWRAGCRGVLIGFESLDPASLQELHKGFNTMNGGYGPAMNNLRRVGLPVYGTFVFGHDRDKPDSFHEAVEFAIEHRFYIAAFNHLTPFPGTPLYDSLKREGRLRYSAWWLDPRYRYNEVPFVPRGMAHEEVTRRCLEARRRFYGWRSLLRRWTAPPTRRDGFMWRNFLPVNLLHRGDVNRRTGHPLGDDNGPVPQAAA